MVGILGASVWYLFAPGHVPEGQPALGSGDAAQFRADFAGQVEKARVVMQVSQSSVADLKAVDAMQQLLLIDERLPLAVFVVWQAGEGEWGGPATETMARIWDVRVRQYWDRSRELRSVAGAGQAALYPRGASVDQPSVRIVDLVKEREVAAAFFAEQAK